MGKTRLQLNQTLREKIGSYNYHMTVSSHMQYGIPDSLYDAFMLYFSGKVVNIPILRVIVKPLSKNILKVTLKSLQG